MSHKLARQRNEQQATHKLSLRVAKMLSNETVDDGKQGCLGIKANDAGVKLIDVPSINVDVAVIEFLKKD